MCKKCQNTTVCQKCQCSSVRSVRINWYPRTDKFFSLTEVKIQPKYRSAHKCGKEVVSQKCHNTAVCQTCMNPTLSEYCSVSRVSEYKSVSKVSNVQQCVISVRMLQYTTSLTTQQSSVRNQQCFISVRIVRIQQWIVGGTVSDMTEYNQEY